MRFTDRVLSLHPGVVTIAFLTLFVGGGVAINIYPIGSSEASILFAGTMLVLLVPLMIWHYSLYRAATDRNAAAVGHRGRRAIFFVLAGAALAVHLIAFTVLMRSSPESAGHEMLVTATTVGLVVGNLSYFAAIWSAANALTRFDERVKSVEFHKTLGTFLLEFYLPIGIWVIYPRIKRVLAEPV
jgi:hypothetical protein